jgi:SAM-dependent methyltransferase
MAGRLAACPFAYQNMLSALLRLIHGPIYQSRIRVLSSWISQHVQPGDRILDVGCGSGALGSAIILQSGSKMIQVQGVETHPRGGEPIPVTPYEGTRLPFADGSFEIVIVADVLHHEAEPERLLAECVRVSRRQVIVKDHVVAGPLAHLRICFLDWAANVGYGVPCLYRYLTLSEWNDLFKRNGLAVEEQLDRLALYPPLFNILFGGRLHILTLVGVPKSSSAGD